jgi:hypothetical protein
VKTITPSEYFEINNSTDNIIEGKQGTLVIIPKNCFTNKNGEPTDGNVKIELAEVFSAEEMVLSNLTTIQLFTNRRRTDQCHLHLYRPGNIPKIAHH